MRIGMSIAAIAAAALVAAGCGKFGTIDTGSGGTDTSSTESSSAAKYTDKPFDAAARKAAGCTEVVTDKDYGRTHIKEGADHKYQLNPPTSGDHDPVPYDWGVYDEQLKDTKIVHNLEHGHIEILYTGISDDQRQAMLATVAKDPYHLLVAPRDSNPKDGFYFTAWDHHMFCESWSPEALQYMTDQFRDRGPELLMQDQQKQ